MGTKDGWVNVGDVIQFIAVYENLDGSFAIDKAPTIDISNDITGVNLITAGVMSAAANLPVYYYNLTAPSAGIYTNIVTWDGGEQSIANIQVGDGAAAQEVWEYAERELTSSASITESQFHDYLTSYPASLPAGTQPGAVLPPANADLVNVQVNCFYNDDTAVPIITPKIKIVGAYFYSDKFFTFEPDKYTYNAGILSFTVPAYCKISITVPEITFQNTGYVGSGGTVINAHDLYETDQTPV